eukprot:TRINITY_DN3146_c1_g1_i1.p1 TRINITY_DN3146_c1_g1~~TRINITY_DN3146_c1_g1_i1.p1  ORF type:complete len:594 (+),score=168.70 TRINITY_DN3146_c1_g1_i1:124-1905(+)
MSGASASVSPVLNSKKKDKKPPVLWSDDAYRRYYESCAQERSAMLSPRSRGLTPSGAARLASAWRVQGDIAGVPPSTRELKALRSSSFQLSPQQLALFERAFAEVSQGRQWISELEMARLLKNIGKPLPISFVEELVDTAIDFQARKDAIAEGRQRLPYDLALQVYHWALLPDRRPGVEAGTLATYAAVETNLAVSDALQCFVEEAVHGEEAQALDSRPLSSNFSGLIGSLPGSRPMSSNCAGLLEDTMGSVFNALELYAGMPALEVFPEQPAAESDDVVVFDEADLVEELVDSRPGTCEDSDSLALRMVGNIIENARLDVGAWEEEAARALKADEKRPPCLGGVRFKPFEKGVLALGKSAAQASYKRRREWLSIDKAAATESPQAAARLIPHSPVYAVAASGSSTGSHVPALLLDTAADRPEAAASKAAGNGSRRLPPLREPAVSATCSRPPALKDAPASARTTATGTSAARQAYDSILRRERPLSARRRGGDDPLEPFYHPWGQAPRANGETQRRAFISGLACERKKRQHEEEASRNRRQFALEALASPPPPPPPPALPAAPEKAVVEERKATGRNAAAARAAVMALPARR